MTTIFVQSDNEGQAALDALADPKWAEQLQLAAYLTSATSTSTQVCALTVLADLRPTKPCFVFSFSLVSQISQMHAMSYQRVMLACPPSHAGLATILADSNESQPSGLYICALFSVSCRCLCWF